MKTYLLLCLLTGSIEVVAGEIYYDCENVETSDSEDIDDEMLLHNACKDGDLEQVISLLNHGANIDLEKNGFTPLHLACYYGHLDIVKYLISVKADFKVAPSGWTLLHIACSNQKLNVVEYLVDNNIVDIEALDIENCSCLHIACGYEYVEICKYLLLKNYRLISMPDIYNQYPLHLVKSIDHLKELIRQIQEEKLINYTNFELKPEYLGDWAKEESIRLILYTNTK